MSEKESSSVNIKGDKHVLAVNSPPLLFYILSHAPNKANSMGWEWFGPFICDGKWRRSKGVSC
jgi:hypothetical protein